MTNQPLITQNELDVLASSMTIAKTGQRAQAGATVTLYDFRDATKLSPDQIKELANRCTVLSKVLSRTLTAYLNAPLSVAFEGLDYPTFDQYIRGLPSNPILLIFTLDPHSAPAVWQIDSRIAALLIDTMLGAAPDAHDPLPHDPTPIEAALLARLFNEILHTWTLTWPALAHLSPTVTRLVSTVAGLDISADAQDIVHAIYRFQIGDYSAQTNLALPETSLQRLLRRLQRDTPNTADPLRISLSGPVSKHAAASSIPIVAQIARLRLPLRTISNIKPGDILPLHQHPAHPLIITIAGTPIFYAQPGHQLSHLAARITTPIPTQ
jgi:flagellar motor switch protein FliM